MSRNAQNSGLATPIPWVRGLVAFSLTIFGWKVHEMSRCMQNTLFLPTPTPCRLGGVNLLKTFFCIMVLILFDLLLSKVSLFTE